MDQTLTLGARQQVARRIDRLMAQVNCEWGSIPHLSTKIINMKKVITILLVMFALQSCGTWKWVEPMAPNSANNHRYNR